MIFHYASPDASMTLGWVSLAYIDEVESRYAIISPPPEVLEILTKKPDVFALITEEAEYGRVVAVGKMHAKMYYAVVDGSLFINGQEPKRINGLGLPSKIIKVIGNYPIRAKFSHVVSAAENANLFDKPFMIQFGIDLISTQRSYFGQSPIAKKLFDEIIAGIRHASIPEVESTQIGKAVKALANIKYRHYSVMYLCNIIDAMSALTGDRRWIEAQFKERFTLPAIVAGLIATGR